MSSVLSGIASAYSLPTKFSALITPSYNDETIITEENMDLPIPFTVVNQVLDINVNQSAGIQTVVTNGIAPTDKADIQGKAFGGTRLVISLGANMTTYLQNWIGNREGGEGGGPAYTGPLVLYIQPLMTKVQLANPSFAINNEGAFERSRSWGITSEAPVSGEYIGGGSANNFYTAWIFKTPMTVQYVAPEGGFKYITFTSQFAEE
jgi:hypothetical protein